MEAYNARESLEIFQDEDQDWSIKEYLNLTVSPELANHLLNNHYRQNRKVKKRVVEKYARDMKAGNWLFTGESIGIDVEGKILDGQHRLMAIRQADINMEIPFAFETADPDLADPLSRSREIGAGQELLERSAFRYAP